ncbi:MAG: redoxin domain-containing protein [Myxococcota bacterium]
MAKSTSSPATPAAPTTEGLPGNSGILYGLLAALLVGLGVSVYLVYHKLNLLYDPAFVSGCNYGGAVNCDKVNLSPWSQIFGVPISLFGIATYAAMAYMTVVAARAVTSADQAVRATGTVALNAVAALAVASSLYSIALALYSSVVVEAWCLYCISLYVVNFASAALAISAGPKTVGRAIQGSLQAIAGLKEPIALAFGVWVIVAGLGWYVYDVRGESMRANLDAEALIKARAAFGEASAAAGAAAPANNAPVAGVPENAPPVQPVGSAPIGVPSGKKTEDGWTFFLTPLRDDEYYYGNPKAQVTVVKYADFECSYCRFLTMTMEPLKAKYKDKVRFVMKQFPMNPSCNPYMAGYDKHPNACNAAVAAECAGQQGKFWDMHDKLYANAPKLDPEANRAIAQELGLNLTKYDACVKDPATPAKLRKDIDMAYAAGIYGTPRTYINGRLVTGSASTAILEYYIQKSLEAPVPVAPGQVQMAPPSDGTKMVQAKTATKTFFIDPYESALTKDGKAVSVPGETPAEASWTEANAACGKAGKRLCTEEEWVSACTGTPAIDENQNGMWAEDNVEGRMYPYGDFYEAGTCVDMEDKYKGKALPTGQKAQCRTPSGLFDMAGNIGEWVGPQEKAALLGGHASSGERAACNQRSASFGLGNRNLTTGFRCCADTNVTRGPIDKAALAATGQDLVGKPVPAFTAKDQNGNVIDSAQFKGKVTLINFFASWCGPCKKEFPELVALQKVNKAKGFQVISIGVDREFSRSLEFAKGFDPTFSIVADEESELMGLFDVYSMPATFIVDRQGVIRFKDTGFKPEEQLAKLRDIVSGLLQ